jgi:hypothetical protein
MEYRGKTYTIVQRIEANSWNAAFTSTKKPADPARPRRGPLP